MRPKAKKPKNKTRSSFLRLPLLHDKSTALALPLACSLVCPAPITLPPEIQPPSLLCSLVLRQTPKTIVLDQFCNQKQHSNARTAVMIVR